MKSFNLKLIENCAKDKPITSITIHYKGKDNPIDYKWENRKQINWNQVIRCRLNFDKSKSYLVDGEACKRPGFRVKPR